MKRFEGLNYYEILEIAFNASFFEIRQAYKDALSIYDEDSLITYSFFTDDEREKILKKIEDAFNTLIDKKKRADYNRMLIDTGKADVSILNKKEQKKPIPLFSPTMSKDDNIFLKKIRGKIEEKDATEISNEILSKELISGDDLKKLRKFFGIEIEEIFEVTRINVSILESIEDNHFESLPPFIYLKNFLKSYAEILQIDSIKIVDGFLKNITRTQKTP